MEYNYNNQYGFLVFLGVIILIFCIMIAFIINSVIPFFKEREYIKMEMERSSNDEEYRHWKRELKYMYLSSIPLIGRFFR